MSNFKGKIHDLCRTGYPFTKEQMEIKGMKLNIGCYYMYLDGFYNIDINKDVKPDIVSDMIDIDKYFSHNSVSLILISQCLEHVSKEKGIKTLKKFYDILLPGGYLIVEVPNGDDIGGRYQRGEIDKKTYDLLMNGHKEVEFQGHDSIYETDEIFKILSEIGFVDIKRMPQEMTSDYFESIRVDCVK